LQRSIDGRLLIISDGIAVLVIEADKVDFVEALAEVVVGAAYP
jgi:hypothetical protein